VFLVFALAAALLWGLSTIAGAVAAKRGGSLIAITLWSLVAGMVIAVPAALSEDPSPLSGGPVGLAALAGVGSGVSLMLLYASTLHLQSGIASAGSNVTSGGLPVLYSFALGERLHQRTLAGAALCLASLVLLAPRRGTFTLAGINRPGARLALRGSLIALLSGVAMSVYYIALASTPAQVPFWSALLARLAACGVLVLMAVVSGGRAFRLSRRELVPTVVCGLTGILGALAYVIAIRDGQLAPVVAIVSLSPIATAGLGWLVLRERLRRVQMFALLGAVAGTVLISVAGA
jgi:drug/metabolite transporter (DMT)-like permease